MGMFLAEGAESKTCPSRVSEKTLEQACKENLSSARGNKYDCLAAGRDEYVDSCALGICAKYDSIQAKTQCVQAARGRIYSEDDLKECAKRYFEEESEGTDCLAARGKSQARFQQLELAKDRGHREGREAAAKEPGKFSLKSAEERGQKAATTVAENYLNTKGFNEGVLKGRASAAPIDANAYEEGRAEGIKLAAFHAADFDLPQGFNEALGERNRDLTPPPLSQIISLQHDKTASLEGLENLSLTHVVRGADGMTHTPPVAKDLLEASKMPPSNREPSSSDLPVGSNPGSIPTKHAPCVAEDDRPCIDAFKAGYAEGYKRQVQSRFTELYRESYKAAFESALDRYLLKPVPADSVEQGVVFESKERGLMSAYSTEYPKFKSQQNQKGRDNFRQALRTQPLVRIASIHFESASGERLVPKNKFTISVEVDNFGEVDAESGQYRLSIPADSYLSSATGALSLATFWKSTYRVLPRIPARTRTRFQFAFEGTAAPLATGVAKGFHVLLEAIGKRYDSKFAYSNLQWFDTKVVPNYPVELVELKPLARFSGTSSVATLFTVKNKRAERSEAYTASISTKPSAIGVRYGDSIAIPALDPEESYEYEVTLDPTVWTSYLSATNFALKLSDSKGTLLSEQTFPYIVDLGMPLGIRIFEGGVDYSNQIIHKPIYTRTFSLRLDLACKEKIPRGEGYRFRYLGSSDPNFTFTGTVAADVGACEAGRRRALTYGTVSLPKHHIENPAALKFVLEKNGAIVQGVQIFVQTIPGTERYSYTRACSTCP